MKIFAIFALYTTVNFDITLTSTPTSGVPSTHVFDYPFRFGKVVCNSTAGKPFYISADVSSDARFFVATAVISILYCVFISAVYVTIDEIYTSKPEVPLAVSVFS